MLSYSRYDIHSKRLYKGALLVIVTLVVHNASDKLRDTPCMEFASTLKNLCVMKLDTVSCSLLMTTFRQTRSFSFKGDDLKNEC